MNVVAVPRPSNTNDALLVGAAADKRTVIRHVSFLFFFFWFRGRFVVYDYTNTYAYGDCMEWKASFNYVSFSKGMEDAL